MPENWNEKTIAEFRANEGRVGGRFEGRTLLLLHHRGAKSGIERVNPLGYQKVGEAFAVFGSKAGAPTNPDWYYNLIANPDASVEVGTETFPVRARVAGGSERERIWSVQKATVPVFADYEVQAPNRQIPVVILEKVEPG